MASTGEARSRSSGCAAWTVTPIDRPTSRHTASSSSWPTAPTRRVAAPLEHAAEVVEGQLALELHGAGRGIDQLGLRRELLVERPHLGLGERDPGAVEAAREVGRRAPLGRIGPLGTVDRLTAGGAGGVEPLADEGHERRRAVGGPAVEGAERDLGDDAPGEADEDPAAADRGAVHGGCDRAGGQTGDQVPRPRR